MQPTERGTERLQTRHKTYASASRSTFDLNTSVLLTKRKAGLPDKDGRMDRYWQPLSTHCYAAARCLCCALAYRDPNNFTHALTAQYVRAQKTLLLKLRLRNETTTKTAWASVAASRVLTGSTSGYTQAVYTRVTSETRENVDHTSKCYNQGNLWVAVFLTVAPMR